MGTADAGTCRLLQGEETGAKSDKPGYTQEIGYIKDINQKVHAEVWQQGIQQLENWGQASPGQEWRESEESGSRVTIRSRTGIRTGFRGKAADQPAKTLVHLPSLYTAVGTNANGAHAHLRIGVRPDTRTCLPGGISLELCPRMRNGLCTSAALWPACP